MTHETTTNVNFRRNDHNKSVIRLLQKGTQVRVLNLTKEYIGKHQLAEATLADGTHGLIAIDFLTELAIMPEIVRVAEREIGTKESPPNSNTQKYGEWFGFNHVAWCAIFVSWVYAHAGRPLQKLGWLKGFASCTNGLSIFRQRNEITNTPQAGSIVFFDWNNDARIDHVGIFVKWISETKGTFETIEGNTSGTNQSNGGEVQRRTRTIKGKYKVVFVSPREMF